MIRDRFSADKLCQKRATGVLRKHRFAVTVRGSTLCARRDDLLEISSRTDCGIFT
jgi:hypothetical protein